MGIARGGVLHKRLSAATGLWLEFLVGLGATVGVVGLNVGRRLKASKEVCRYLQGVVRSPKLMAISGGEMEEMRRSGGDGSGMGMGLWEWGRVEVGWGGSTA
ncbi:Hypothetical predicted protein [Olea europaea subsp. europaea]|uniref:Uncharacterized protein n=1 Tax=Olea europaea subsp. europaea TaxID=158383 RepID=A0A8S0T5F9_OLEEU|nr:Hypothetical predicted protein [Olea europaea subsp. europaea]